jgi:hypothetical protein
MDKNIIGPILSFKGQNENKWYLSALIIYRTDNNEEEIDIDCKNAQIDDKKIEKIKTIIYDDKSYKIWKIFWSILQTTEKQEIRYVIIVDDIELSNIIHVPAIGMNPHMMFTSCNGFQNDNDKKKMNGIKPIWTKIYKRHKLDPYNLMLMSGDQIYSDGGLWELSELQSWHPLNDKENNLEITNKIDITKLKDQLEKHFFNLYYSKYSEEIYRECIAEIPSINMWDDHDIFDGWGSYENDITFGTIGRLIYNIAREYFIIFQLHESLLFKCTNKTTDNLSTSYKFNEVGLVVMDTRSDRCDNYIMNEQTWTKIKLMCTELYSNSKYLLIMSSVPFIYPDCKCFEKILYLIPNRQDLEDDLCDHWTSGQNICEYEQFIDFLSDLCKDDKCKVVFISGDVHLAAHGQLIIKNKDTNLKNITINQLISSPVGNIPVPKTLASIFEAMSCSDSKTKNDTEYTQKMLNMFGLKSYIPKRNWMTIKYDNDVLTTKIFFENDKVYKYDIKYNKKETCCIL